MQSIRELKVIGIDESRPPVIRKEPYIELFFKINNQAPKDWCIHFNDVMKNAKYPVKIKPEEGVMVETWVRGVDEIEKSLKVIQLAFVRCSDDYIENIESQSRINESDVSGAPISPEQMNLNNVVSNLKF